MEEVAAEEDGSSSLELAAGAPGVEAVVTSGDQTSRILRDLWLVPLGFHSLLILKSHLFLRIIDISAFSPV